MMAELEEPLLPADWRFRDDWSELVLKALFTAWLRDDGSLIEVVDIGDEMAHYEVYLIPEAIASVAGYSLRGGRPQDFNAPQLDLEHLLSILDDVRSAPDSLLKAKTLRLAARVIRNRSDDEVESREGIAISLYHESANSFDALGLERDAATARQSQAAVMYESGDVAGADDISLRIVRVFDRLGELNGAIGVRLNLVQYAITRSDRRAITRLLDELAPLVARYRDGHFQSAYLVAQAQLQIQRGNHSNAKPLLMRSLRSSRRRDDVPQQLQTIQDLAAVSSELGDHAGRVRWLREGVRIAARSPNRRAEQEFLRMLASSLLDGHRYNDALRAFLAAAEIDDRRGLARDAARSRADASAVLAAIAIRAFAESTNALTKPATQRRYPTDAEILRAQTALLASFEELLELRDVEWVARVGRNLETLWFVNQRFADGADFFESSGRRLVEAELPLAADHFGIAAQMGLADHRQSDWVIERYLEAAKVEGLSNSEPTAELWSLARAAAEVGVRFRNWEISLTLYDLARDGFAQAQDHESYASVQNDGALACEKLGDLEQAESRLREVLQIAEQENNRVLLALAQQNLGEIALRRDDREAGQEYLRAAAFSAEEIGDYEAAASIWASLAGSLISGEEMQLAEPAIAAANRLAQLANSPEALARAKSAAASVAFLRNDFDGARRLWRDASRLRRDSGLYYSFVLDSWAAQGDWPKFRTALNRYAKKAQKEKAGIDYARHLMRSVGTWLRQSETRHAANTAAWALLLAIDGYSRLTGRGRTLDALASHDGLMVDLLAVFSSVEMIRRESDLDEEAQGVFALEIQRQIAKHTDAGGLRAYLDVQRYVRKVLDDEDVD